MEKKILKRFFALWMILTLVFSVGIMSATAAETIEESLQVADFLNRIGISAVDDDNAYITRGDFAVLAVQAMKIGYLTDEIYFSDVSGEQGKYINTAASVGIVSIGDGCYYPDRIILREESAAIVLRILGYDDIMEDKSYPLGYLAKAATLGLLNGLSDSKELTGADASRLIYNMLNTKYVVLQELNTDTNATTHTISQDTYIKEIFEIYRATGVIRSICGLALNDSVSVDSNKILIDNTVYLNPYYSDAKNYLYLGRQVSFYTRDTEDGAEVLYFYGKTNMLSIPAEDIKAVTGFDASDKAASKRNPTLIYEQKPSETEKNISLDAKADIFVNGVARVSVSNGEFQPESGIIYLTDTDNDKCYDVIAIEQYTYYYVSAFDANYGIVSDEHGKEDIRLENFSPGAIEYVQGTKKADESIITVGAVLEVMCSYLDNGRIDESKFMRIGLCSGKVSGVLESIDDEGYVTINGVEYRYLSSLDSSIREEFGRKGTFLLGREGFIVACDAFEGSQALNYAYLVGVKNTGGLNHKIIFRLYTLQGKMIDVETTERLKYTGMYDGSYVYGKALKKELIEQVVPTKELVKYELDKDGKLSLIQFAIDRSAEEDYIGYDDEHFTLDYKTNNCYSYSGWLESGHAIYSPSYTTCMYVSTTSTLESDFAVGYHDLRGSTISGKPLKVYDANYQLWGGVAVFEDVPKRDPGAGSKFYNYSTTWLITGKKTLLNDEGDPQVKLEVARGQTTWTYQAISDDLAPLNDIYYQMPTTVTKFSELEPGDVISVTADASNDIAAYVVLHDYDRTHQTSFNTTYQMQAGMPWLGDYRCVIGRVTQFESGSVIRVDNGGNERFSVGRNNTNYMVYNTKNGKVRRPTGKEDIYPGDYVYLYVNRNNVHIIVKYEE